MGDDDARRASIECRRQGCLIALVRAHHGEGPALGVVLDHLDCVKQVAAVPHAVLSVDPHKVRSGRGQDFCDVDAGHPLGHAEHGFGRVSHGFVQGCGKVSWICQESGSMGCRGVQAGLLCVRLVHDDSDSCCGYLR
jgi:hypothetical protein